MLCRVWKCQQINPFAVCQRTQMHTEPLVRLVNQLFDWTSNKTFAKNYRYFTNATHTGRFILFYANYAENHHTEKIRFKDVFTCFHFVSRQLWCWETACYSYANVYPFYSQDKSFITFKSVIFTAEMLVNISQESRLSEKNGCSEE